RDENMVTVTGRFTPPADFGGGQLTEGGIFVGAYGASPTEVESPMQVLALSQNYPNPFNPTTTIAFVLPEKTSATLAVYDVSGRLVKTLITGVFDGGYKEHEWNGTDAAGHQVGSGVYFCRLTAGNRTLTKKMVFLK
ncbi:MAG: T9SS type A sorting domain-containing protein, partial [Candidatus Latescibacterota bacterium]